jgi:hypothetical protein
MWWVWAIVALVALLAIAFVMAPGRPAPNDRALREHRRDDRGLVNPSDPRIGGRPRSS